MFLSCHQREFSEPRRSQLWLSGSTRAGAGVSSGSVVALSTSMIRDTRKSLARTVTGFPPTPPIPIGPVGSVGSVFGFVAKRGSEMIDTAHFLGIKDFLSCQANALR